MKSRTIITLAIGCALLASAAFAGEPAKDQKEAMKPVEWKSQTVCPVMGGKIDSSAYTDIQGQRVYHCCPMCTDKLTADPDTYFKKAAADGIQFENVQTTCPICGMAIEKDKSKSTGLRFEGRHLYFCSDGCSEKFLKDPQANLKKIGAPAKDASKKQDSMDDHSGHTH